MKVLDPDDKVRIAVCKIYGDLDFETATYHVTLEQLQAVGERVLDKKVSRIQDSDLQTLP